MGEFKSKLQEKVDNRRKRTEVELTVGERLLKESRSLQNALAFLEKTATEAKEGWYIDSCKSIDGQGFMGKLDVLRKKLQRKSLHWYLEPVCDDQSAYNQKIQQALKAMEDFAKAQMAWNQALEAKHQAELEELQSAVRALQEKKDAREAADEG